MPKRSRSSGGGVGSGAGSSESARGSRSTGGRDGRGEGDVGSRSAAQDFEESAHFLASGKGQKVVGGQSRKRVEQQARRGQGGGPESGSWAAGWAAASRMAKRPGAAASRMAKRRQHPVG